ncbi:MAG: hypothetical protein V3T83_15740 [Acidobacteriota bacterium]
MSQVMSGFDHPRPLGSDTAPKRCAASERPVLPLLEMAPEYPKKTLEPLKEVLNQMEARCGKPQVNASKLSPGIFATATPRSEEPPKQLLFGAVQPSAPSGPPQGAFQVLSPATISGHSANRITFRRGRAGQS